MIVKKSQPKISTPAWLQAGLDLLSCREMYFIEYMTMITEHYDTVFAHLPYIYMCQSHGTQLTTLSIIFWFWEDITHSRVRLSVNKKYLILAGQVKSPCNEK